MDLNNLIFWYQKKIGTYDKQQWEKTIEQRIFGGFTHVPMRTAKLKTEFIDVDLVRGSSFPKAKPKHGFSTVAYLAIKRLVLLPLEYRWWIQQTSPAIFLFLLLLYILQIYSIVLYYIQTSKDSESDIISISEILIPLIMMLTLSMVHSQIVSTHSGSNSSCSSDEKRQRIKRSKRGRYRFDKMRTARNLSDNTNPTHSSQQTKNCVEISSSVRFAKKVIIENFSANISPQPTCSNQDVNGEHVQSINNLSRNALSQVRRPSIVEQLNIEENIEILNTIHQDDDGFESLNGNDASSDNDRENVDTVSKEENKTEQENLTNQASTSKTVGDFCNNEDLYDNLKRESTIPNSRESPLQCESEEEGECEEMTTNHFTEATTSATEWMGVTTNSDECSYSSEFEESETHNETSFNCTSDLLEHPFSWEFEIPPSSSSCTSSDRVSCTIWTRRDIKKAKLSVLDISSAIIARVESMPESMDYFYGGLILAIILSLVPSIRRLNDHFNVDSVINSTNLLIPTNLTLTNVDTYSDLIVKMINVAFGSTLWERSIILISAFERLVLSFLIFFLLAVAERTYKQRLLYAKLFSHLTSSRRARKSDLPHFRLNKVQNIRTWLSIRSYLKRRGPQRSVDVIVSSIFIVTLLLLSFVSLELIKELDSLHYQYNVEALFWSFAFGMFILRFMTLGTKINKKYRNLSVLITEQINLYLQIEQKPHKKDELMVANSVLKLAADLIKELENPFKISGLSDNPYLYTITKVVLLSALSGVLSELLGFKLKLHKIKIK